MSVFRKRLLETADGYVAGFNAPGADFSGVVALHSPDYLQQLLPMKSRAIRERVFHGAQDERGRDPD